MGFADRYLQKHAIGEPLIPSAPDPELHSIIAIPAYNESGLTRCLDSLFSCTPPDAPAEVIVLINSGEQTPHAIVNQNRKTHREAADWSISHQRPGFTFHVVLLENLPAKHFGAGLARKLVMDEAVRRFNQPDHAAGIILSLDADTMVEQNYLREVTGLFDRSPDTDGCSIRFAHPLEPSEKVDGAGDTGGNGGAGDRQQSTAGGRERGDAAETFPAAVYDAIVNYELHQRYYLEAVRYTGYPYATHTVGSAFAVRAGAYCRQGGMSKRQAGEDFYFIQKVAMQGNFSECNTASVYPSPRPSDRVPFGTGPAISRQLSAPGAPYLTYAPGLFRHLRSFYALIPTFFACGHDHVSQHTGSGAEPGNGPHACPPPEPHAERSVEQLSEPPALPHSGPSVQAALSGLPALLQQFLEATGFVRELAEIHRNVASEQAFRQRFFRKFNMFRILKYLHFADEQGVGKVDVGAAALEMLEMKGEKVARDTPRKELLSIYRKTQSADS